MCCNHAASCVLEAGNTCTYPKLRLTEDPEDNQENCQCVSLKVEHPSKHVTKYFPHLTCGKQLFGGMAGEPAMWQAVLPLRLRSCHSSQAILWSNSNEFQLPLPYFLYLFLRRICTYSSLKNTIFIRTQYFLPHSGRNKVFVLPVL